MPVVLAPMAGITNMAYRRLCREYGAGLYVCEMITSRALVERTPVSMQLIQHHESETPRSIQLYGVEPNTVAEAASILVGEDRADHIDLNFGCPVPKVTRKGGGAALPWKLELFRELVTKTVRAAGDVPVTVKMRKGIDEDHLTYLDAARIARDAGVAAVSLHARTANEHYSGHADWSAIATLKEAVTDIPILGNGDIWSAADALRMVDETGADGVVVGRGCLGRPWLFGDLAAAFRGEGLRYMPSLGEVADGFRRHAELLVEFFGSEEHGCRDIRKHVAWYFKGYPIGSDVRAGLAMASSLQEIDDLLGQLDHDAPYPGPTPRGRAAAPATRSAPPCPTAGSSPATSTASSARSSPPPSCTTAADERHRLVRSGRRRALAAGRARQPPLGLRP